MIIYVYYRYFRYIHIYIYALYTCICMYISFSDKVFGLPITTLDCHCGCSFQAFKSWDFYSWRSNIIVLCGYHGDIYPLFTYVIAFQQCFLYHLPFLKKDTVQKWRKVVAVFFMGYISAVEVPQQNSWNFLWAKRVMLRTQRRPAVLMGYPPAKIAIWRPLLYKWECHVWLPESLWFYNNHSLFYGLSYSMS